MNNYASFVREYVRLLTDVRGMCSQSMCPDAPVPITTDAPTVLLFSPHPDDECVIGALPLRLRNQSGMRIINVAVTLGSNKARQQARREELDQACKLLGYASMHTGPHGLERVQETTRIRDHDHWSDMVTVIADILRQQAPQIIFMPHEHDAHATHRGTNLLVMDALHALGKDFSCLVAETEYWSTMNDPNLMVEASVEDIITLGQALICHKGEVERNAYHLFLPGWMHDNVRRGSELVAGMGAPLVDFTFANMYRVSSWNNQRLTRLNSRVLASDEAPNF